MSGRFAITGRVVTMDGAATVHQRGTVYVDGAVIAAVQDAGVAPPQGFEAVQPIEPGVTIYPGLVELHNHLTYDALPLWNVPAKYGDRGVWQTAPEYQQMVTHPMGRIGADTTLVGAVVRYVETKCLLGGTTTSQGVSLAKNAAVRGYYQGAIRVVESPRDASLPAAATHIPDIAAKDREHFLAEQKKHTCMLLHLSEGLDPAARRHFTDLQGPGGDWAIAPSLAGIHCTALQDADFAVLASHQASMVWSPLSNQLLYGGTADVAAARREGVRVALGSDWSPSGSKNLFGELKVAHALATGMHPGIADHDLLAMATCNAAAILGWSRAVGALQKDARADLLLLDGTGGDAYTSFFEAAETAIVLVMIDGVAHYGRGDLLAALGVTASESVEVGGKSRALFFDPARETEPVKGLTFSEARSRLAAALQNPPDYTAPGLTVRAGMDRWSIELDELGGTGMTVRPLIGEGLRLSPQPLDLGAAPPLPPVKLELSAPTVADDGHWFDALGVERNLPGGLVAALQALY